MNRVSNFIGVGAVCLLFSCANERVSDGRTNVESISNVTPTSRPSLLSIKPDSAMPACKKLHQLASAGANSSLYAFQVFSSLRKVKSQWYGSVSIENSPFTQVVLGEKFSLDDDDTFYEKAKAERAAGRLGSMKWMLLKFMRGIGLQRKIQFRATNEKLEENFPGIFGKDSTAEKSLYLKLAKKAANLNEMSETEVVRILTAKLPIFVSADWDSSSDSMRETMASALKGFNSEEGEDEKLCSFTLFQYHFAQLLRLKGHRAPITNNGFVYPLSDDNLDFSEKIITGAFLKNGKAVTIESDSISMYDPLKDPIASAAAPPSWHTKSSVGGLGDSLGMIEGLLTSFEATSPASPWVSQQGYLLGDIQADGPSMLPYEAHALSLGLLTIHFKNLAYRHIKRVNREGLLANSPEEVVGFALDAIGGTNLQVTVRLEDLVRLSRVSAHLENALGRFLGFEAGHWEKLNPVYNRRTLESLLGREFFQSEVAGQEAVTPLRESLQSLKLPLAAAILKMLRSAAAEESWDLTSGKVLVTKLLDQDLKIKAIDALESMARENGSSLLKYEIEKIR